MALVADQPDSASCQAGSARFRLLRLGVSTRAFREAPPKLLGLPARVRGRAAAAALPVLVRRRPLIRPVGHDRGLGQTTINSTARSKSPRGCICQSPPPRPHASAVRSPRPRAQCHEQSASSSGALPSTSRACRYHRSAFICLEGSRRPIRVTRGLVLRRVDEDQSSPTYSPLHQEFSSALAGST